MSIFSKIGKIVKGASKVVPVAKVITALTPTKRDDRVVDFLLDHRSLVEQVEFTIEQLDRYAATRQVANPELLKLGRAKIASGMSDVITALSTKQ